MSEPDPLGVAADISKRLEALGIRFLIVGSIASSIHGEPRATNDIDMVADIAASDVEAILHALEAHYYVQGSDVRNAVADGSSFNAVHRQTYQKVDVFVAGQDEFTQAELGRAMLVQLNERVAIRVATAEDLILSKLRWFELGNRVSDRQWRDILGVVKEAAGNLDVSYLQVWADRLQLGHLLARCLREADVS